MARSNSPEVGDLAPDFDLTDAHGKRWKLSDFRGKQTVVVYFYPKDETAGCTAQACEFRDRYEDFKAAGAEVIGISRDDARAHSKFAQKHGLPFTLLSDPDESVHEAYGVRQSLGILSGRITFVVDRDGRIRLKFDSLVRVKSHIEKALGVVRTLEGKAAA